MAQATRRHARRKKQSLILKVGPLRAMATPCSRTTNVTLLQPRAELIDELSRVLNRYLDFEITPHTNSGCRRSARLRSSSRQNYGRGSGVGRGEDGVGTGVR
jgi:hypothetical protein